VHDVLQADGNQPNALHATKRKHDRKQQKGKLSEQKKHEQKNIPEAMRLAAAVNSK